MKTKLIMKLQSLKAKGISMLSLALVLGATSCVESRDLYQGPTSEENMTKDPGALFNFSTSNGVDLQLDYGYKGYSVFFEVYTQNPLNEDGTRNEEVALYKGYTDENSSFAGSLILPAAVKTVYIYSRYLGVPACVEAAVENNRITLDMRTVQTRSTGDTSTSINIGNNKREIANGKNLFALYDTYESQKNQDDFWTCSNSKVAGLYSVVAKDAQLTAESTFGQLVARVNNALGGKDNSKYLKDDVNVTISDSRVDEKIDGVRLDVVLVGAFSTKSNALGYYYYKTPDAAAGISAPTVAEIHALPKYMVFPRIKNGLPKQASKARLQFFGENFDQEGTDIFPVGYTVGWMLVPSLDDAKHNLNENSGIGDVEGAIITEYGKNDKPIYSNKLANSQGNAGCIAMNDELSQKVIVGFEDQSYKPAFEDKGYNDVLFYVDTDFYTAILDPEKPTLPEEPSELEDETYVAAQGTLAFEDIWPYGADYDMNDVVVEYKTTITINGNDIKSILDEFTCKHKRGSAQQKNAFGILINDSYNGVIDTDASNFFAQEEMGKQFIMFDDGRNGIGNTFTLMRVFNEGSYPDNRLYKRDYNPFLAPLYKEGEKNRIEVHLPKSTPTTWASENDGGENAYYVSFDGSRPFAIDLVGVLDFEQVTERSEIGSEGEYPRFSDWVKSHGTTNQDWYTTKE